MSAVRSEAGASSVSGRLCRSPRPSALWRLEGSVFLPFEPPPVFLVVVAGTLLRYSLRRAGLCRASRVMVPLPAVLR